MAFDGYEGGFLPDLDFALLIHAAWVNTEPGLNEFKRSNMCMACSNCKHRAGKYKYKTYHYCPWCGAKMDLPVAMVDVQDDSVKNITFVGKIVRNKNG